MFRLRQRGYGTTGALNSGRGSLCQRDFDQIVVVTHTSRDEV